MTGRIMRDGDGVLRTVKAMPCWWCGIELLPHQIAFGRDYYRCETCQVEWTNAWKDEK